MRNKPFFRSALTLTLFTILALFNHGCETETSKPETTQAAAPKEATKLKPFVLLAEPAILHPLEHPASALPHWQKASSQKPVLLLLSNDPFLISTPDEKLAEITQALQNNPARLENFTTADPLMFPNMSVDYALRQGWFSQLAWALPLRDPLATLSKDKLTEQLLQSQLIDQGEADSMSVSENWAVANIRNTEFVAAALKNLPKLDRPVVVHIDLSYFQPLYKNEISTPLFPLIFQTLEELRQRQLNCLAVTFSYGNLENRIALDVRFIGEVIKQYVEAPATIDQPVPANWQRQSEALYLSNFFQKEKIRELFEAQEQDAPDSAWVKFNLYRSAAEHKEGTKALDYMAEAVKLDPVFAMEYFNLTQMAYEKGRPDEAMRMLRLAGEALPDDPQIKLQIAQMAVELKEAHAAAQVVKELQELPWSNIYYPQMPEYLESFTDFLEQGGGKGENTPSNNQKDDPRRQRILK
ncbi:MAG: hypothetical protein RQ722_00380 [Desulfuromonadales bacterium]|nr:hypothetical protein [Desulfuromonadales bacterium]